MGSFGSHSNSSNECAHNIQTILSTVRLIFNLCMPYTSRHEITCAVESIVRERIISRIEYVAVYLLMHPLLTLGYSDVTEKDVEAHLMTSKAGSPPLDIWVRTSGVKRLSDYLLWQVRADFTSLCLMS